MGMQLLIYGNGTRPRKTCGKCMLYFLWQCSCSDRLLLSAYSIGRIDDVLMLSSGEKVVPAPIEEAILADKRIRSAILFGRERNQVGVLIEPAKYDQEPASFVESIWPTVNAATADSPNFSRIFKHLILVTKEDKPILRADKGTVKKKATLVAYSDEIDALSVSFKINYTSTLD
jgi:hypothetical protein